MALILKQFPIGPMANFGYLIGDDRTREAMLVDPAWSPPEIFKIAADADLRITAMAITHAHFDHTNAIDLILDKLDIPLYAQPEEIAYAKSGTNIVGDLGRTVKPVQAGEKLLLGDTEIEFLHTPGHTPGSQCLKVGDHLLTGDTLFIGGCGRSDLPGGNAAVLYKTLQRLARLPGDLEVCPGHDYGSAPRRRLAEEVLHNPYLTMGDETTFVGAVTGI